MARIRRPGHALEQVVGEAGGGVDRCSQLSSTSSELAVGEGVDQAGRRRRPRPGSGRTISARSRASSTVCGPAVRGRRPGPARRARRSSPGRGPHDLERPAGSCRRRPAPVSVTSRCSRAGRRPGDVRRAADEARERCGCDGADRVAPRGTASRAASSAGPRVDGRSSSASRVAGAVEHAPGPRPAALPRQAPGQQGRGGLPQRLGRPAARPGRRAPRRVRREARAASGGPRSTAVARSSSSRAAATSPNGRPADVRQRRAAPQRRASTSSAPACAGSSAAGRGDERLEPERVDVVRVDGQPVAARNGLDDVGAERPAQPRHERLQRVGGGVRRFGAPQRVDQRIPRHCAAGVEREAGERAAEADATGRRCAVRPGGHRAEHSDPHGVSVQSALPDRLGTGHEFGEQQRLREHAALEHLQVQALVDAVPAARRGPRRRSPAPRRPGTSGRTRR